MEPPYTILNPTKEKMTNTNLIDDAKNLIQGSRNKEHGAFADNVSKLGMFMQGLTGREYSRHELRSFFIALKLCRRPKDGFGEDSLKDLIGYIQLTYNDQLLDEELAKGEDYV